MIFVTLLEEAICSHIYSFTESVDEAKEIDIQREARLD